MNRIRELYCINISHSATNHPLIQSEEHSSDTKKPLSFDDGLMDPNKDKSAWTAPHVWGTAPPKSPAQGAVSSFLGQEYTPPSPSRSRPRSLTVLMNPFHQHPPAEEPKRVYPTLNEVLHNTSPAPYTLSSFMAYLSMMHSLESLEFLLDASRYRAIYSQTFLSSEAVPIQPSMPDTERVKTMWLRLIDAYVRPGGSREVNLPSDIRDTLLRSPAQYTPPPPEILDPAVNHIYNLMRDGVLASFIAHCDAQSQPRERFKPLLRHNSTSSNSTRSSSGELTSPIVTSQPISIPYPMSPRNYPPAARSMGYLSQSVSQKLEESHLDAWIENTPDEMSDIEEGRSSSGRASPMTPPQTPPPIGEGSPAREGGLWGRKVREKFRLRRT